MSHEMGSGHGGKVVYRSTVLRWRSWTVFLVHSLETVFGGAGLMHLNRY